MQHLDLVLVQSIDDPPPVEEQMDGDMENEDPENAQAQM